MGWLNDDGDHGGFAAAVWPDGRVSLGHTPGGAEVLPLGSDGRIDYDNAGDEPELRDGRTAIGWRGVCECGWSGPLWELVGTAGEHDEAARRVHVEVDKYAEAPDEVEKGVWAEWHEHVRLLKALAAVAEAAQAAAVAEAHLTDAVRAARAAGNSWTDLGAEVGITGQAAHERWAKVCG
ncbi:hypothetical protein ACFY4C_41050 [Actinomadura viridis]|uniref:hypothetical protein n=1 Tax=Actinomadura viridis TaxID=58110 RepID=UPI0036B60012